jgi:MerR HTH family regulatory protein
MTEAKLTIGHVANAAGVNVETVRYYQRRGLVADQEVRAVESQLSLALSSVDVDQLSRLWADERTCGQNAKAGGAWSPPTSVKLSLDPRPLPSRRPSKGASRPVPARDERRLSGSRDRGVHGD